MSSTNDPTPTVWPGLLFATQKPRYGGPLVQIEYCVNCHCAENRHQGPGIPCQDCECPGFQCCIRPSIEFPGTDYHDLYTPADEERNTPACPASLQAGQIMHTPDGWDTGHWWWCIRCDIEFHHILGR